MPSFNKDICSGGLEVVEGTEGPCAMERCREQGRTKVRSWQTLEACIPPGSAGTAVIRPEAVLLATHGHDDDVQAGLLPRAISGSLILQ